MIGLRNDSQSRISNRILEDKWAELDKNLEFKSKVENEIKKKEVHVVEEKIEDEEKVRERERKKKLIYWCKVAVFIGATVITSIYIRKYTTCIPFLSIFMK